jgi:hypothetical protein
MIRAVGLSLAVVVSASLACVVGTIVPPGGDTHAVFHHIAVITFLTYVMGAVPLSIWYRRTSRPPGLTTVRPGHRVDLLDDVAKAVASSSPRQRALRFP